MSKHARQYQPGHAITRIDHYLEWLHRVHVNEREGVPYISIDDVVFRHLPGVNGGGKVSSDRQVADSSQARVQADGEGPGTAELHAIILPGVVLGGNHHPGARLE